MIYCRCNVNKKNYNYSVIVLNRIGVNSGNRRLKVLLRPTNNSFFSLDFNTMLTKNFILTGIFLFASASTNFKILRELSRGENDVNGSLV